MEKEQRPKKFYSKKLLEAAEKNVDDQRQNIDVLQDFKKVLNAVHSARVKAHLTDDQIYHLIEIAYETEFIHITITPHQIVTCFRKGKCTTLF